MRKIVLILTILGGVVGTYYIGGGLIAVYRVHQEQTRLQQAIDEATLPGLHLFERTPAKTTREIWQAWFAGHVPEISPTWEPGETIYMRAQYYTDATPMDVSKQYRVHQAGFHPSPRPAGSTPFELTAQVSGVEIDVSILAKQIHFRDVVLGRFSSGPENHLTLTHVPGVSDMLLKQVTLVNVNVHVPVHIPEQSWRTGYPMP